jgi:flap endonuclease-1
MGTDIGEILSKEDIELRRLGSRVIAVDGHNTLYQFLAIIRGPDGRPLSNREGKVTSHLSGIFYRTCNLLLGNIRPASVFDGKPPDFKTKEIHERSERREEAQRKYDEALRKGELEEARKFGQASARVDQDILSSGKELLQLMGIPTIDAPSEGEAEAAYLNRKGLVYATGSQDYDSALFGAPFIVRNLAITGRRKLPGKNTYIEVNPELIDVEVSLRNLGISREDLILIGMIIGTDYTEGIKGIGPKKALALIKQGLSVDEIYKQRGLKKPEEFDEIKKFFLNPPAIEVSELDFGRPDQERILSFLVDRYDFSEERVKKAIEPVILAFDKKKSGLGKFIG